MAKPRHRRSDELKVLQWLRVGAVAAGVGAAVVAGQGVAAADTGASTGTEGGSDTSTDSGADAGSTASSGTGTDTGTPPGNTVPPDTKSTAETGADGTTEVATGGSPKVVISAQTTVTDKKNDHHGTNTKKPRRTHSTAAAAPQKPDESSQTGTAATTLSASTSSASAVSAAATASAPVPALAPQASVEITKVSPAASTSPRPIHNLVLGVLRLFGFSPAPGHAPNNPILAAIWGTYRRIESFLGNQSPTVKTADVTDTSLTDDTVTVTGTVTATDPDGDALRYSATDGEHGTVTVDASGKYTYTLVDPSYTGTDTFTVTVNDDATFHLHGLSTLRPNWGHTSTATISVTLTTAPNVAPVISGPTGPSAPDDDGVVSGSFAVTDANRDAVTIAVSETTKGTVEYTVTPDTTTPGIYTVRYTYTPTEEARLAASVAGSDDTEEFSFTATDGTLTSAALSVTATIAQAPNQAPVISGATTGSFIVTDANGDTVTIAVSETTKGTVEYTITPDTTKPGVYSVTYTYTPTYAGRLAASYAGQDGTEEFSFTASDGTLTSDPLTVTATIEQFQANTVIATVDVGNSPQTIVVSPDGATTYVTNRSDGTISVIDTATATVKATITVGSDPYAIVLSPDGATAYVTNAGHSTVSVIDTETNTVTTTITGVGSSIYGLTISPDGKTVYVASSGNKSVVIIDTGTNTVTGSIGTGQYTVDVAISPDGKTLYATNYFSTSVTVIDTASKATTSVDIGSPVSNVTVGPDGTVYVTRLSNGVAIIDPHTRAVTSINTGTPAAGVSVSPDGTTLYIASHKAGTVTVVDLSTKTIVASIPIGTPVDGNYVPSDVAESPDSALAYTANNQDGTVSVIWTGLASHHAAPQVSIDVGDADVATGAVELGVSTSDADGDYVTLAVSDATHGELVDNGDGTYTYTPSLAARLAATGSAVTEIITFTATDAHGASSSSTVEIAVLGLTANSVIGSIDLGKGEAASYIVLSTDGKTAYATATSSNNVVVVDVETGAVTTLIPFGSAPVGVAGLALTPDGSQLWAVLSDDDKVAVIDTGTNTVIKTLTDVGGSPLDVTFTPDGKYAYIVQIFGPTGANVVVVNTATGARVASVATATSDVSTDIVMAPDGKTAYAVSNGVLGGVVRVIDTGTNTVVKSIDLPAGLSGYALAISPDGSRLYAPNTAGDGIAVIDTATNTVVETIATPGVSRMGRSAVSPDGSTLYVVSPGTNTVAAIDLATKTVTATITLFDPEGVAFRPDGTSVYVTSGTSLKVITTGLPPYSEAV